jgi:hypothetical protein
MQMSKYEKAKKAARNRDAESLAWELVLTSLQDIEDGNVPDLGKSVLMELIKTVSAGHRNGTMQVADGADAALNEWSIGTTGRERSLEARGLPTTAELGKATAIARAAARKAS